MRYLACVCVVFLYVWHAEAATLKISVEEPTGVSRKGWPVTSGIPLAQGALKDAAAAALFTADGREVPLQTEALARWGDGSIRWLLLDFQVDLAAKEHKSFSLRYGPGVKRAKIDKPVRIQKQGDVVVIDTGPIRLQLPPKGYHLLGNVMLDLNQDGRFEPDERVTDPSADIVLWDDRGRSFSGGHEGGSRAEMLVEQAGPLRACVRIEGHHASADGQMFRYVVRMHAFRGQRFVRFFYTFVNDHQDSLMARVRVLGLQFELAKQAGAQPSGVLDAKTVQQGYLFQVDENHYELNRQPAGRRAVGWAAAGGDRSGLAVGLREFWQNWPKSIEYVRGTLWMNICPHIVKGPYGGKPLEEENKLYYYLRDGRYTFKVGVAKTHELWATFYAGEPDVKKLSAFFRAAEDPLLAVCEPAHVNSTKAAGELPPADPAKYAGYDRWLGRALDAHLERREKVREYGMLNYGDWYGERQVNWGNLEYDLAHGLFLQYLRTGDRRFFLRAEQAARHHIDVDVVHAVNPHLKNPWGPPPKVGEIWLHCLNHTGGYYEDEDRLPVSRTYQMGHSTNFGHVWVSGDLDYYYLTGDRRAREVAVQVADAMVRHMPTSYGTHIRALGWPMILVLEAYAATGEKKYLEAATKNWEVLEQNIDWKQGWVVRLAKGHCLHQQRSCYGNVPFMEGLTLCALARYHRITNDPEVLKAIGVGIDQMIRECWQEDVKTFRYTACPLSSKAPYTLFMLSVEAMAYEAALTGNREHLRILREGFRAAVPKGDGQSAGKGLAQMIYFAPHGLAALKE